MLIKPMENEQVGESVLLGYYSTLQENDILQLPVMYFLDSGKMTYIINMFSISAVSSDHNAPSQTKEMLSGHYMSLVWEEHSKWASFT